MNCEREGRSVCLVCVLVLVFAVLVCCVIPCLGVLVKSFMKSFIGQYAMIPTAGYALSDRALAQDREMIHSDGEDVEVTSFASLPPPNDFAELPYFVQPN